MPQGRRPPRPPFGFDADHPRPGIGWRKQKISAAPEEPEPVQLGPVADVAGASTSENKVASITPLYPPCPSYLKGAAAELWPAVVRKLVPEGDWDDHDSELVVALYCVHAAMATAAMQQISTHGPVTEAAVTGVPMHSPWRKVLHEAAEGVMRFGELLKLTPDARYVRHNERHERARRRQAFEQGPR
jgi:phage terminase small subunit